MFMTGVIMCPTSTVGVAYDSYSDIFFWTIDGSLGKVIGSQSTMESDAQDLYDRLTNPFSLKLDWVTRRLFWVQDGNLGVRIHFDIDACHTCMYL